MVECWSKYQAPGQTFKAGINLGSNCVIKMNGRLLFHKMESMRRQNSLLPLHPSMTMTRIARDDVRGRYYSPAR
jgi:hypothetical protein